MSMVLISKTCPFCERRFERHFPAAGYYAWKKGALIQDAFQNDTADAREFLITGICPECFDSMGGDDDDAEID